MREKEALDALLASASLEANVEALSKEYVPFHIPSPRMELQFRFTRIETYKATCAGHATEREEQVVSTLLDSSRTYLIGQKHIQASFLTKHDQ